MFKTVMREIFYSGSFLLLILSALELVKPQIVLAYFNLNLLLIFCLVIGIFIVLLSKENKQKSK